MGNNFCSRSLVVCSLLSIIFRPYPIFQKQHRWCIGRRARLECGSSWSACSPRMRQFVVGVLAQNAVVGVRVNLKTYTIGMCCFTTKHVTFRSKNKNWFVRNQDNIHTQALPSATFIFTLYGVLYVNLFLSIQLKSIIL